jgi:AcrR family transcriptional regulator
MAVDEQRAEKSVEKVLVGTMSMLGRQGARKLSVSDICAASGVARGTFYRYFSSKEEVLAAVNRHFENGITAAFGAAIEVAPDPALRVPPCDQQCADESSARKSACAHHHVDAVPARWPFRRSANSVSVPVLYRRRCRR